MSASSADVSGGAPSELLRPRPAARADGVDADSGALDAEAAALAEVATAVAAAGDLLREAAARLGAAGELVLPLERMRAAEGLTAAVAQVHRVQALVGVVAFAAADPDAYAAWRDVVRAAALAKVEPPAAPAEAGR
jgi:hypothetical protein